MSHRDMKWENATGKMVLTDLVNMGRHKLSICKKYVCKVQYNQVCLYTTDLMA